MTLYNKLLFSRGMVDSKWRARVSSAS